ncbi:class I SAM-dependent RNA methyltransferase [Hoyosella rhizosphaerae]|uniref:23S rRNA methyltransferase n=1 Tax=Hoyosella rhizosphaerae TaxID=1755582 RepID=A0A916U3Y4_9ACTN|nr:class I SAM-dependent RNA methyltransferase [Hoyosella rhizosphaerae]MBN4926390.1 class I SAM-dependent RNA methyltransferase [Hoyosella rhizosphaerae]GGC59758.1 23S rRNA methyltransferase [Hoyosella rhizosphaerae]
MTNWVGQEFSLTLGDPAHGGFCVGRHEGRVVFVRHGISGEQVRVRVAEDRGGAFCFANVIEVVSPSAERISPMCCVSSQPNGAGCCDLSHMTAAAQRQWKADVVSGQFRRIAHLDRDVEVELLDGGPTQWRTRARFAVDRDGRAGMRRYRSNDVIVDLSCPQPVDGLTDGIAERRWTPGSELHIAVDSTGERHISEQIQHKVARRGTARQKAASHRAQSARRTAEKTIEGSGRAQEVVRGRTWDVSATGFWQAHRNAPTTYSSVIAEWAELAPGETAWDLYSGAGVFAAELAAAVGANGHVDAVEASAQSVADGTAAVAEFGQISFHGLPTERAFGELRPNPAVVVLDPPRSGAGRAVVSSIAEAAPRQVIHIGCDPAAFARDVALYAENGYRLADLRVFDAFPLTHHVECVGIFQR